jgi:hypothetical protein
MTVAGPVGRCRGVQPRSKTSMMIEAAALSVAGVRIRRLRVPEDDAPVSEVERSITRLGYRFCAPLRANTRSRLPHHRLVDQ